MAVAHTFALRGAVFSLTLISAASVLRVGAQEKLIALVPHRAIYDLSLGEVRGNAQIAGVRGRILYDFDGSACQGYSLQFRQVSELDTGEGKHSTSDLRSTTWEGGDAKSYKFTSENFVDENLVELGCRSRRAWSARNRGRSRQAGTQGARYRRQRSVPNRAYGAGDRSGARRQVHSRFSGL